MGVVESVRPVQIDGPDTGVGAVGGAALGGFAGSADRRRLGANAAGAIVGAILGGIIGNAVEQRRATSATASRSRCASTRAA